MTYICKRKKFHEKIVSFGTLFRLLIRLRTQKLLIFPPKCGSQNKLACKGLRESKSYHLSECVQSFTHVIPFHGRFFLSFHVLEIVSTEFSLTAQLPVFSLWSDELCNYPEHEMARSNPLKFSRGHYNLRFIPRAKQTESKTDSQLSRFSRKGVYNYQHRPRSYSTVSKPLNFWFCYSRFYPKRQNANPQFTRILFSYLNSLIHYYVQSKSNFQLFCIF